MEKLMPILSTAFAALALVVSIIVLLQVMGIKTTLTEGMEPVAEEEVDPSMIPLAELKQFSFDENFILTFPSLDKEDGTVNVVVKLGFALHTVDEDALLIAETALTSQGQILRDRIRPLLTSKDASYFKDEVKEAELKAEILALVQTLIGNEAVVDVYFPDKIVSEK